MEFMQYRTESGFQGCPPVTAPSGADEGHGHDEEMSVEDLVLSMRQDLFVDPVTNVNETGSGGGTFSVHRQPGAVSVRINGVGLSGVEREAGYPGVGGVVQTRRPVIGDSEYAHVEHWQHDQQTGTGRTVTDGQHQKMVGLNDISMLLLVLG